LTEPDSGQAAKRKPLWAGLKGPATHGIPRPRDAVAEIAGLLAVAYQRYRRARRIDMNGLDAPESVNGELDNPRPESPHVNEVDA
jgi:hypothetical protein